MDPLARQSITADGFALITREMMKVAHEVTKGRLVYLQEGCAFFVRAALRRSSSR
jgi:acetoin utilization deacetylase AcuC-like enzyme